MRISTSPVWLASSGSLASLLVLGALATPARAERRDAVRPGERVAAAGSVRADPSASLTTGELRLTGLRAAGAAPGTAPAKAGLLEATEVAAEVRPYAPDIERCYLERLGDVRRAGRLALTFVIGRDGYVVSLDAAAPGLPARTVRQMTACIREVVEPIHFPARRGNTTAIVPYLFQHTNARRRPAAQLLEPQGLPLGACSSLRSETAQAIDFACGG